MSQFSKRQYEWRALTAVALYSAYMLLAWPLVKTTASLFGKAILALVPAVMMFYLIGLMARRIRAGDELEQRTHLIALGIATAVVGALSLAGGFLSIAGVWKVDGAILIWVFPVSMLTYALARWSVQRRYGISGLCGEEGSVWAPLRLFIVGVVFLFVAAVHPHRLDNDQLGFLCGIGVGLATTGLLFTARRFYRHRHPHG